MGSRPRSSPALTLCLLSLVSPFSASQAWAQERYPSRPVRLVIPYPPGGGGDFTGRELAQKLTEAWGQQVIADNRPGAGTSIAHNIIAKAVPDGYTLGLGSPAGMVVNPALGTKLPYDAPKDFTTIGLVVNLPFVVAVPATLPVNNMRELIALAKAQPGKLNFASPGAGTPNHLGGEMLNMMAGVKLVHVAYKGAGLAATDLASGTVQIFFSTVPGVMPFIRGGRVKAIAAATLERFRGMPELPTVAEVLPGFDCSGWYGLVGPAGISKALVTRISGDLNRIVTNADFAQRMLLGGVEAASSTPESMQRYIVTEQARWRTVIKNAGIAIEANK